MNVVESMILVALGLFTLAILALLFRVIFEIFRPLGEESQELQDELQTAVYETPLVEEPKRKRGRPRKPLAA